jgi:hypothetical protein
LFAEREEGRVSRYVEGAVFLLVMLLLSLDWADEKPECKRGEICDVNSY